MLTKFTNNKRKIKESENNDRKTNKNRENSESTKSNYIKKTKEEIKNRTKDNE